MGWASCSCPWERELESHAFSTPSKIEINVYHPYPMVAPTSDCILPSVHPEVPSISTPQAPAPRRGSYHP